MLVTCRLLHHVLGIRSYALGQKSEWPGSKSTGQHARIVSQIDYRSTSWNSTAQRARACEIPRGGFAVLRFPRISTMLVFVLVLASYMPIVTSCARNTFICSRTKSEWPGSKSTGQHVRIVSQIAYRSTSWNSTAQRSRACEIPRGGFAVFWCYKSYWSCLRRRPWDP